MKNEDFDKEIAQLYQQRKSGVNTPDIQLNDIKVKHRSRSWLKISGVLSAGGFISFGIMAVISHFTKIPKAPLSPDTPTVVVEVVDSPVVEEKGLTIRPSKPLPLKPEHKNVVSTLPELSASKIQVIENEYVDNFISLPTIKSSTYTEEPTFKVMPKYQVDRMLSDQTGTVKLGYSINNNGKVHNIEILDADVNRALQNSAKQALSKWKFKPVQRDASQQEIIFDFQIAEGG